MIPETLPPDMTTIPLLEGPHAFSADSDGLRIQSKSGFSCKPATITRKIALHLVAYKIVFLQTF
jgi:hypothetical protein